VASGALFPVGLAFLSGLGRLRLRVPPRAWYRLDLWLLFTGLITVRVIVAVVTTTWAILTRKARPGIVAAPIRLHSGMGRSLLSWAVTVTPGTIALLVDDDLLYVHCLRRPADTTVPGLAALEGVLLRLWG
jgi:multisubunit Na+/H+ antiporter MnhE subunit